MKLFGKSVPLDRIEAIYLAILRVGVLAVATLCLLAALWFAGDGLWRVFIKTEVAEQPTVVSPAEVAAATRRAVPQSEGDDEETVPEPIRERHAAFARTTFAQYYAIYKSAADAYKKPEDELLGQTQLMEALGYDLNAYAEGGSLTATLFVEDESYQSQALEAVRAAMTDPAMVGLLETYKAAEKTEQSCSTRYERRRVNDVCYDWYYGRYNCTTTRSVPVERCVAVYPDGIVSPLVAFGRADTAFQTLWSDRAAANAGEAARIRAERHAAKAMIGPKLALALQIAAGFLVVMFFFLLIAVERHLRSLSAGSGATREPS